MALSKAIFTYKIKKGTHRVQMKDIVYLESYGRKMVLHLADGNKVEFYGTLKEIYQESLSKHGFIQVHKSYIVNFKYIAAFKYLELTLSDGGTIPVSKQRRRAIRETYFNISERMHALSG